MHLNFGDTVMVSGVISRDGSVILGPGIEVKQAAVDIITDIPVFDQPDQPKALVLFFATDLEREQFAQMMADEPGVETRSI